MALNFLPEISLYFGIIIGLFYNEHNPPHFHVRYNEFHAEVEIETLRIISGNLPRRAKIMVLEWAEEHRDEQVESWNLAREMNTLKKIKPLE